jgi:restriction endonuclease S subunit
MTKELINLNSNSAQPGINKNSISQLKILLPPEKYIHEFDDLIAPITNKIFSNELNLVPC